MFQDSKLKSVHCVTKTGKESKSSKISTKDVVRKIASDDSSMIRIQIAKKIEAPARISMLVDVASRDISIIPVLELS